MRYLIFMWSTYYPSGGMNDLVLETDSLEEANTFIRNNFNEDSDFTNAQIYDTQERVII